MAASVLPTPGSVYGPCTADCSHRDCAATRAMAAKVCRFCGKVIGYGIRFYKDPEDPAELVHADCFEDALEAERKGAG